MKNLRAFIAGILYTTLAKTFAIVLDVPPSWWNQDIEVSGPTRIQEGESTLFAFIQFINTYLRFFLGAITMWVLVYAWFRLLTAAGNEERIKQTTNLLIWTIIGIVVVLLSYAIVRLVVNLL